MPDLSWWMESSERLITAWDDASAEEAINDLIENLKGFKFSDRTSRLLCCGFCRQAWKLILHKDCREAIQVAEAYADRQVDYYDMDMASRKAWNVWCDVGVDDPMAAAAHGCADGNVDASHDYPHLIDSVASAVTAAVNDTNADVDIVKQQGKLFAAIVGPGWEFYPQWKTDTVVRLAGHIYEERDFSAMPILADALQDAGCEESVILAELRDPDGQWCRGCRILDVILGKR